MAKRKQIGMSEITGEKGIALIHRIVLQMGFAWNPTNMDAGIDGYIELRDSETGEVSNCILQVQSKAGDSYFLSENENSFVFQCKNRDLEYWLAGIKQQTFCKFPGPSVSVISIKLSGISCRFPSRR
ncbi:DUF4365 domain-containing protein [Gimesia panareensis]|uniref:DUF4365 domain-containing protein n=1 Tax=Gimesia panareensis TaxID=2527978 RepID=UPI0018D5EF6C|nr:DUF4365 domain-containing protein [Gimesia panareensis]